MVEVGARHHFRGEIPPARFRRPLDIASAARSMHVRAVRVERAAALEPAVRAALATREVSLIEIMVDPAASPPMGVRLRTLDGSCGPSGDSR
jgi:thiamine pyrophosphate-dependent acetolactate synthase large subunit-like protein